MLLTAVTDQDGLGTRFPEQHTVILKTQSYPLNFLSPSNCCKHSLPQTGSEDLTAQWQMSPRVASPQAGAAPAGSVPAMTQ